MTSDEIGPLVAGATRVVLAARLSAAALTLVTLPGELRRSGAVAVAVLLAAVASSVALHRWKGVGSLVVRHPMVLGLDAVPVLVVLGLVGAASPWLLVVLSTAVLAGLFYGPTGAAVFTVQLVGGHALGLVADLPGRAEGGGVFRVVVVPLLVAASATGAAAVRLLLERVAASAQAAREGAARAATADERARLARELHDSVAKTLHGVAMTAEALERSVHICPERASAQARLLAEAARTAARESRDLLSDLRADEPSRTLEEAVGELVAAAAGGGLDASADIKTAGVDGRLRPEVRYEVVAVLREAMENVARHAHASTVHVSLHEEPAQLELVVRDDGVGMPEPAVPPTELSRRGHHGMLGMTERARRCEGSLRVEPAEGGGTEVRLCVPLAPPETAPAAPPVAVAPLGLASPTT